MRRSATKRGFLVAILAAVGLTLCFEAYLLWQIRQERWNNAVQSAQNVLRTLSTSIERNLNTVDLSLSGVQDALENYDMSGLDPAMRNMLLFDRAANAEYLGSMLVLSPNGNIVYDSGSLVPRIVNFADRDYFQAQKERRNRTFLSSPYESRVRQGDPSIALSRRITLPDGGFGGVVIGAIRLAYFKDLFSHVTIGRGGVISLTGFDGHLVMRVPTSDGRGNVNQDVSKSPTFQRMMQGPVSYFSSRSAIDGVTRHYVYERIGSYPLVLAVAFSVDQVFRDWFRQALALGGLGLFISGALVLLAMALQRALKREMKMKGEMESLATTDGLTGLANRRHFETVLAREWAQAARTGDHLSLLVIDVDHFKTVNDRYGHAVGDEMLKVIAGCIRASVPANAVLSARYGGEEFAVLLAGLDEAPTREVAERIRLATAQASCANGDGGQVTATVSIGISTLKAVPSVPLNDLFRLADKALYLAKANGRNRTILLDRAPA
ncbi:diguanylate cyclase [Xanthobacteraceae bacterium A53D]